MRPEFLWAGRDRSRSPYLLRTNRPPESGMRTRHRRLGVAFATIRFNLASPHERKCLRRGMRCLRLGSLRIPTMAKDTAKYIRGMEAQMVSRMYLCRGLSIEVTIDTFFRSGWMPTDLIMDCQSLDVWGVDIVNFSWELTDSVMGAGIMRTSRTSGWVFSLD